MLANVCQSLGGCCQSLDGNPICGCHFWPLELSLGGCCQDVCAASMFVCRSRRQTLGLNLLGKKSFLENGQPSLRHPRTDVDHVQFCTTALDRGAVWTWHSNA